MLNGSIRWILINSNIVINNNDNNSVEKNNKLLAYVVSIKDVGKDQLQGPGAVHAGSLLHFCG